ncbi:MAG: D-alanyl-D-alanine endopeptidase [Nitrosomonas sp.]|nr:D-alanyl-D-alanine endopeptidase [Nitrosomonas sp.]
MKQGVILFCVIFFWANSSFAQQNLPNLRSHAVMVLDTQDNNVIYDKNANSVVPIASITKLMTAMVILDAQLPMGDKIVITSADVDRLKNTRSRLSVGSSYARHELLRISLMSSENRAAAALGRTYPGGIQAFVRAMNKKAFELGMIDSYFVEPTGLSSGNVSTARDLAKMVAATNDYGVIREFSTTSRHIVSPANRKNKLQYINSNSLVRSQSWQIDVSKTGYLNEAGRCLVMQANIAGKPVVIVLLNSWGKNTRIGDANRVRKWMENVYARKQV